MKTILSLTLFLLSLTAQAQFPTGFPFYVTQPISISGTTSVALTTNTSPYLSDKDRAVAEGMPIYGVYGTFSGTMTAGQSAGAAPQPGTMWYVDDIVVTSSEANGLVLQLTNSAITPSSIPPPYSQFEFGSAGGVATIPFNRFFVGRTGVNLSTKRAVTSATYQATYNVFGVRVSSDFFKPAERFVLKLGDSISEGSGITNDEEEYDFQVVDSLQKYTAKKWRIISKAKGSFTSSNLEALRLQKNLYFPRVDWIIYHVGTNNSSAAIYDTDLGKMLTTLRAEYPNAVITVCGPTTRTDSQETINAAIRTNALNRVTALNSPIVKFTNFGALWTQTQQSTYVNADNIHPKASGHSLMAGALWGLFTANNNALVNYLKSQP